MFVGDVVFFRLPLHTKGRVGSHVIEFFVGVTIAINAVFAADAGAQGITKYNIVGFFTFDH